MFIKLGRGGRYQLTLDFLLEAPTYKMRRMANANVNQLLRVFTPRVMLAESRLQLEDRNLRIKGGWLKNKISQYYQCQS